MGFPHPHPSTALRSVLGADLLRAAAGPMWGNHCPTPPRVKSVQIAFARSASVCGKMIRDDAQFLAD